MGHDKLRKFAENETFSCLLQPSSRELLSDGYRNLHNHPVKGNWHKTVFPSMPKESPIVLELGCGKGEYTIALARRNPDCCFVGVDIKGARLWKGAKYATENKLPNVAFLRTRVEFIEAFFACGEVSDVWLTFSDPQYKSENSRLSSPVFLSKYRSFVGDGGRVHLKTDSSFLYNYTLAVCRVNDLSVIVCTDDLYGDSSLGLGESRPELFEVRTFYEEMFLNQGYKINYLEFSLEHEGEFLSPKVPEEFDPDYFRSVEGPRLLFGHDSAETRRLKLKQANGRED